MPPPSGLTRRAAYIESIIVAALGPSRGTDPPDDAGSRNLEKRTIAGHLEFRVRIGLAEVAHRAVVGDPGAAVRPELDVGRAIESTDAAHKGLLEARVVGEPRDFELKRLFNFGKVKELDLMTGFWGRWSRIRSRKAEIALQRIERRSALHRTYGEGVRREVDAGERGVGRLDGQR
jgi:hypothetical protein